MGALVIAGTVIMVAVTMLFVYAMCKAAGTADEEMERLAREYVAEEPDGEGENRDEDDTGGVQG